MSKFPSEPGEIRDVLDRGEPAPHELYERTGGGDAYRVAMLEHGYVIPTSPGERRDSDKRVIQCGLLHDFNWSDWRVYKTKHGYEYEARWCRTCGTTQAREPGGTGK